MSVNAPPIETIKHPKEGQVMVTFCGRWGKRLHSGEICKHEVREFVESCRDAGWDSVAVAEGYHILAAMRNGRVWFKEQAA